MMAVMTRTERSPRAPVLPAALIALGAAGAGVLIAAFFTGFRPPFPASLIWTAPGIVFALGAAMLYARAAGPDEPDPER